MVELEKVFETHRPDLVSVVGDVNSTLAAALVAAKMAVPASHVEAGLRSFDRTMPEEINRLVTDRLSDWLLTPSPDANENLRREGVEPERIVMVGNVMIDSLLASKARADQLTTVADLGLTSRGYAVSTLHRPSNVDEPVRLGGLLDALGYVSRRVPVIFPAHPRTRKVIAEAGLSSKVRSSPDLRLIDPMGYLEFLALTSQAKLILTDSGGLQEESTALNVPCLTVRENTERPVTVSVGTNLVVGTDPDRIKQEAARILEGRGKRGRVPDLWDGHTSERIADLYQRVLDAT
jgi:UDP-N-acetylglucosamine 2-epimerase (non-hydrolysing)